MSHCRYVFVDGELKFYTRKGGRRAEGGSNGEGRPLERNVYVCPTLTAIRLSFGRGRQRNGTKVGGKMGSWGASNS